MNPQVGAFAVALAVLQLGCCQFEADSRAGIGSAPHITEVDLPDWPPMGPEGKMHVTVTDNGSLDLLRSSFTKTRTYDVSGTEDTVTVTSDDLGEGYGTLTLQVYDTGGRYARRQVTSLLVDLTPPEIVLMNTKVRKAADGPNTHVELWAADGWVLGHVDLEVGGTKLRHEFPAGYPATIATTWDASLVRFEADALPAGSWPSRLTAVDAAGNASQQEFDLLVDATPPRVEIKWPWTGTHVEGVFEVRIAGSDDEGDVQLELRAAGAPLTTVFGPEATIEVDATDFIGGPLQLEAIAIDEAGNRSDEAGCMVIVE